MRLREDTQGDKGGTLRGENIVFYSKFKHWRKKGRGVETQNKKGMHGLPGQSRVSSAKSAAMSNEASIVSGVPSKIRPREHKEQIHSTKEEDMRDTSLPVFQYNGWFPLRIPTDAFPPLKFVPAFKQTAT